MKKAVLIQAISKYSSFFVQMLVTMVLARMISPYDFGVLAIVTVFIAFFTTVSDMGFSTTVVQFDLNEEETGALFGFSIVLGFAFQVLFCAASFPISWFYGETELIPLCCIASLSLLFSTLNMVPNGLLLREMKFLSIGVRLLVATVSSGVIAIILAAVGFGVYALVFQMVVSSAIVLAWNLTVVSVGRINFRFRVVFSKVFSYSAFQFGFTFVNYFSRNFDNLLIGKCMGSAILGFYDKAYKLTTYPVGALAGVVGTVIQPFMAKFKDESDVIFCNYRKVIKLLSLLGAYATAILFCSPEEIVLFMYGDQWMTVVPVFQALSLTIYVQMIGSPSGGYFQSLGRTDLQFKVGVINTAITIAFLLAGLYSNDIDILASLIACAFYFHMAIIAFVLVKKGFGESLKCYMELIPEALIASFSIIVCLLVKHFGLLDPSVLFIAKFLIITGIFVAGYFFTGQFSVAKKIIRPSAESEMRG